MCVLIAHTNYTMRARRFLKKNGWVLTQAEDKKKEKEAKELLEKAVKKKAKKETKEAATAKIGLEIAAAEVVATARKKERDAVYVAAKADAAKKRAVTMLSSLTQQRKGWA